MKTFYLFLACCLAAPVYCQQLPLFSQYREYSGIINPASVPDDYRVFDKYFSAGASYRKQWVTDMDGPTTQVLRADYVLERKDVTPVLGAYILNDQASRMGMTGAYFRAAMVFSDEKDAKDRGLSLGLTVGLVRYGLDLKNARVQDPTALAAYDITNALFPDVGLGIYTYTTFDNSHVLSGGLSIPQIMSLNTRFRSEDGTIYLRRERHYYGTIGYKIPLNNDDFSFLEGSVWIRFIPPLNPSVDFNLRYQFNYNVYIGTGFGTNGNAHLEGGILFGEDQIIRLGVSADLPFSQTNSYYGTSLEANVGYAF